MTTKNFFARNYFYLDIRHSKHLEDKLKEFIEAFGGRIDQFLDTKTYLVTDVPEENWPQDPKCLSTDSNGLPHTGTVDKFLKDKQEKNIKLMSAKKCLAFCKKYISSNSSEDDDDENKHDSRDLRPPFIKFEDLEGKYRPTFKEFTKWPEPNLDTIVRLSKSIFCDDPVPLSATASATNQNNNNHLPNHQHMIVTSTTLAAAALTGGMTNNNTAHTFSLQQIHNNNQPPPPQSLQHNTSNLHLTHYHQLNHHHTTSNTVATNNRQNEEQNNRLPHAKRRRLGPYCELCNKKVETLKEHIECPQHKQFTEKCDWKDVQSVIESLPTFEAVTRPTSNGSTMLRLTDLSKANGVQQFVPLHDIVSQIVFASRQSDEGRGPSL